MPPCIRIISAGAASITPPTCADMDSSEIILWRRIGFACVAAMLSACTETTSPGDDPRADPRNASNVVRGEKLYQQHCAACHGDGRLTSISRGRRLDGDAIFRGDSHHLLDFRHALRGGRIQFGKHLIEAAARRTQDQHTCRLVADIAEGVAPSAGAEKETAGPDAPYPSRLESLLLSLWRKSTPRSGPVGPGSILMRY